MCNPANRVREALGEHLDNPQIGADLARRLHLMQHLFRSFVDDVGAAEGHGWDRRCQGTDSLSVALGRLRALVGVQLSELAAVYDLEISDDLSTIVPDESGWFFERFTSG